MILNFYSVFDQATGAYMRPFAMLSDGQALRGFTDEACNAESEIGKHPHDFSLWFVGSFDDSKGEFHPATIKCIGKAHECIAATRVKESDDA